MPTSVVVPANLGQTIKPNAIVSNKYDVNVDNSTITVDPSGVLSAKGGNVVTPLVTTGHDIADILNPVTNVTTKLKETITKFVDAVNTSTYTDEAGVDTVLTKIATNQLTLDATAKTITSTVNGIASNVLDVSGLYADINVDTVNYDSGTYVLTLTETDGTVHTINLASLVAITAVDSTTVDFTGDGTTATPLTASVKVDASASNLITTTANGVIVDKAAVLALHTATVEFQDAFGVSLNTWAHATTNM